MRAPSISKITATLAMLSAAGLFTSSVRADCLTPEPLLLWSYPTDGDRDVPTNALFWFTSSQTMSDAQISATLNGRALPRPKLSDEDYRQMTLRRVHVDPGPLAPSAAYTLVLDYAGLGTKSGRYELRFTTGAGPIAEGRAARVHSYATEAGPQSFREPCAHIVASQGCPDYIPNSEPLLHRLDVEPDGAIAWLLRTEDVDGAVLWPAACGMPRVMLHGTPPDRCFMLQAVAPGGLLAPETRYCLSDGKAPLAKGPAPTLPIIGIKPLEPTPSTPPAIAKTEAPATPAAPTAKQDDGCSVLSAAPRHGGGSWRAWALALAFVIFCRATRRGRRPGYRDPASRHRR